MNQGSRQLPGNFIFWSRSWEDASQGLTLFRINERDQLPSGFHDARFAISNHFVMDNTGDGRLND